MKLPFSSPPLVGLDIQPDGVRVIQLRKIRNSFLIERVATSELPSGIFVEGKIKHWDLLGSVLAKLVQALGIKNLATVINLSANLVRMQRIQIPSGMTVSAIEAEIQTQVSRDYPGIAETLCLDFTETTSCKHMGYSDIFFVVARQEYVSQYVDCVNAAGLKVKIVDIDIFTLKRLMNRVLLPIATTVDAYALVYVLNHRVSFILFNANDIIFHQQWDMIKEDHFHTQLKNRLQIFYATLGHISIQQWAICAAAHDLAWITREIQSMWKGNICYPDPINRIKCGAHVDVNFLAANASAFLIACGSAMREVPRW